MATYDPSIIQAHADRLYRSANLMIVLCAVLFGAPGMVVSSMMNGGAWWLFAAAGAGVGALIGISLAFNLKLKAQLALCQMRIEANTAQLLGNVGRVPPG